MRTPLPLLLGLTLGCADPANPGDKNVGDPAADTDTSTVLPPVVEGSVAEFFQDGTVQALEFEISEAGMQSLRDQPNTWVEATFVWEGLRYGPVAVRLKGGGSSFRTIDQKPSLKVKFNEFRGDGRFLGLRRLTLNNLVSDPSMLRERVAYRVFRDLGSPAPRCNHTTVTINGVPYGLYANVESGDEELLQEWYTNWEGPLWELQDADFRPGFTAGFELEDGVDNRTQIDALTAAMLEPDAATRMFDYVHQDAWYAYFTIAAWVGNFDAYPFSNPGDGVRVYLNPTDGLFHFLPNGLDESFGNPAIIENEVDGILATACLAVPACKTEWRSRMVGTNATAGALDVAGYVVEVGAEIDAYGDADTKKEYADAEVDAARIAVAAYAQGREAAITAQMAD